MENSKLAKTHKTFKTYPRYHLKTFSQRGATIYHTRRKRSFLYRLNGLRQLKTLKFFSFSVEYFKDGLNESIKYTKKQFHDALNAARIFSSALEIKSILKDFKKS